MSEGPTQAELEMLAARYADIVMALAQIPEHMAHSEELLESAQATGNADMIRIFETANLLAKHRYGKIGGIERQVRLAEKVRQSNKGNALQSSQLANRISQALLAGDAAFISDMSKGLTMIEAQPSATNDARFFALIIARDFRNADIEPTKADVREEVTALMKNHNRAKGTVRWQRDVWPSHPELASLRGGRRGEDRKRLPER